MRRRSVLLAALFAVALFVLWLSTRTRQPPLLPRDEAHSRFEGAGDCLVCHGPDGPSPQSRNHPLGRDCLRCHGTRGAVAPLGRTP
jgi:hypothetical protein